MLFQYEMYKRFIMILTGSNSVYVRAADSALVLSPVLASGGGMSYIWALGCHRNPSSQFLCSKTM